MSDLQSQLTIADGIGWITLNRPSRGNALSSGLVENLLVHLAECVTNPSIHTVVFTGAGRHFCTGFDLEQVDESSDGDLLHRLVRIETLLDAVWRAPLRTVALAQGRVLGAGADLWVACDQRVLALDSSVCFPGAGFGLVLGTRRLALRVGAERALEWTSSGATIDCSLARHSGLATNVLEVVAPASSAEGSEKEVNRWQAAYPLSPTKVDRITYAGLKAASRDSHRVGEGMQSDHDLAALVRSAARPGLKARLIAYRDRNRPR